MKHDIADFYLKLQIISRYFGCKMEQISLLDEIKRKKVSLKPQETIVTATCGQRYVEKKNEDGELKIAGFMKPGLGYVIDNKPDLQISEILPYLFLSSQDVVQNSELLIKNNITHVLSIGVNIPSDMFVSGIVYRQISLLDLPEASLLNTLDSCFEFIENARIKNESNKILTHCNAGYSRSPSVVIAYLMKKFGYSLEKSIQFIREKRNICPNVGFMNQLRLLEKQLIQEKVIQ